MTSLSPTEKTRRSLRAVILFGLFFASVSLVAGAIMLGIEWDLHRRGLKANLDSRLPFFMFAHGAMFFCILLGVHCYTRKLVRPTMEPGKASNENTAR
jgi:hypothetical protein